MRVLEADNATRALILSLSKSLPPARSGGEVGNAGADAHG